MKLIVFDWDGTLMDSAAHIVASVQRAARDTALPEPDPAAVRNVIGLGLREALARTFRGISREQTVRFVDSYRQHFILGQPVATRLFPGAESLLRELKGRGYLLAVATGKGRNGLNRELKATGLEQLFDATRCADETFSKPHPMMLQQILDEVALEPRQALMVGDTEYDLEMAGRINMPAVGVSWGVHEVARLRALGPLDVLDSLPQLLEFLGKRSGE